MKHLEELLRTIEWQRAAFEGVVAAPCPFYGVLLDEVRTDVLADGPVARVLEPHAHERFDAAYVLRLLGGAHRMALSGESAALARHFPSTGGDGDAVAAARALQDLLAPGPPPTITGALARPPQTNEVGRAVALTSALLVVAGDTGRPVRLREIGSSGGLNLRLDAYWYQDGDRGWGDRTSAVRFVDRWPEGAPPFDADLHIVDRRGCDRDPVDVSTEDGALTLLSYIWPQPADRFETARAAIDLARRTPVTIDRADALAWTREHVTLAHETTTVLAHSVVWQYLDAPTQAAIREHLDDLGSRATPDAPLAWVRLEPHPETYAPARLEVTLWDGTGPGRERLLATSGFHGGPLYWQEPVAEL